MGKQFVSLWTVSEYSWHRCTGHRGQSHCVLYVKTDDQNCDAMILQTNHYSALFWLLDNYIFAKTVNTGVYMF